MSDKSEACPMCGMPVGMDVEEYNKLLEAEKTTPQQQDNNEFPITTPNEGEAPLGNAIIPPPAPQEPKKKSKMGLVIGVVAGILAIAAIAGFFFMKGHEAEKTSEEQIAAQNETQLIEEKTLEALDRATDPCLTALNQLYNNYVFGNQFDQFELVVNDLFTMKGKQKLLDAYDYECETGDCYGIWALRTMAQDGEGESKIIDITPLGNNKYTVKYLDMGSMGETMLVFAEEGGKMKIDDFRTIFDESYDENVGYMSKDNLPHVYANAYDGFVNIRQAPQSEAPILGVLRNGPEGAILLGAEGEWVKIDCNGIEGYVYGKYVQDTPTEVYEYWGALRKDASSYRFTENDLSPLTAKELTYLRNSVYARHGYVFKSQELNNYYKQFSWYHPNPSVTDAALNSTEKANVDFILNYQKQNDKTYKPQ